MTKQSPITWRARLVDFTVHDGDTLTRCTFDIGWHAMLSGQIVRITSLRGPINAPEVTGDERAAGMFVLNAVNGLLFDRTLGFPLGDVWVESESIAHDAYGRTIGRIILPDGSDLGSWMLDNGLAKPCGEGGKRIPFTAEECAQVIQRCKELGR